MIRERHEKVSREGTYTANGLMRTLRAVWNTARKEDEELPADPTLAVEWNPESRRDAAIPLAKLPKWFEEVSGLEGSKRAEQLRDFYLLTLLTGLRRRTVTPIRREHIDLKAESLFIPKPKGGPKRAFTIPLSDAALKLVRRILRSHNSEWLFPADSKSGHIEI
jgi:integrase